MERLKRLITDIHPKKIVDLATGNGSFIQTLLSMDIDFDSIIGIDSSITAIEAAKKAVIHDKVTFMQMDIEDITLQKYSFDAVCLSNSIHHMQDLNKCIGIMTELIRPGGILLFNEMYSGSLNQQQVTHTLIHHFWAEIDRANNIVHNETLDRKEIIKAIKGHERIGEVDIWNLEVTDQKPLKPEDYVLLKDTLVKSLDRVKDHKDFEKFEIKAAMLEKRLDTIGFLPAPQIIVVAKVMTY
ncbi:class I SAM-dependent methyltransferase [Fusibacter sp. A1]|nr:MULTISPECIES: methyltransferase domain-containing protein [unclassified Fusibacter]MCK8058562.1 methyltransferase domain-containing protein [Fusibacter sp. A2]NPE22669.1 methyltransferase domain-containing protein [Fusibacter sp. A1]RXV60232.1 class I SAM-dependent methyltransferase [Fusibacter sp. A1]